MFRTLRKIYLWTMQPDHLLMGCHIEHFSASKDQEIGQIVISNEFETWADHKVHIKSNDLSLLNGGQLRAVYVENGRPDDPRNGQPVFIMTQCKIKSAQNGNVLIFGNITRNEIAAFRSLLNDKERVLI